MNDREWIAALAKISQLGFTIAACVIIGVLLGRFLDTRLDTSPWLTLLGSLLGMAAAFKSIFDFAAKG